MPTTKITTQNIKNLQFSRKFASVMESLYNTVLIAIRAKHENIQTSLTLTRPLRIKLRISADSSLIRRKKGTFLYKMM